MIDAGAAAGCLVWLRTESPRNPKGFARGLTVVLLASSVAGNAVVHGLAAHRLTAPWWLVVAVSAVAPAVLGAVVHLAVLVAQGRTEAAELAVEPLDEDTRYDETPVTDPVSELISAGAGRRKISRALGVSEHEARRLLAERNGAGR